MQRLPDWPARFGALVAQAHARAFNYGEHDCCLWPADAVAAVTGIDPAAALRGTYATELEAQLVLRAAGGLRGLGDRLGPRIPVLTAGAGDIGVARCNGKPMGAVCAGEVWLVCALQGLIPLPLSAAVLAWRI